jgi:hypothetical protein
MKSFNLLFFIPILSLFTYLNAPAISLNSQLVENPIEILAAQQITAQNLDQTYQDPTPVILFAIPIYKVFVGADGIIQDIQVFRIPSNPDAHFTVQLGIDAIRRAEPFQELSSNKQPVVFFQTFLFRDDLKFKLRVLDK